MNKRDLKLDKYGITNKRYKELCGFCEQYPEWKEKIQVIMNPIKAVTISDMPGSPNHGQSDTTGTIAVKIADLSSRCKLIEDVAKEADEDLWKFIIKSVCYEVPINYLITIEEMPCGKSAFYEKRRYFFFLLDKKRK